MTDTDKTQEQLVQELDILRARLAKLEQVEAERERAEEALRESEEKYRLHFENANDVIYSIDAGLRILTISPSVERHLGYRPDELIGQHIQDIHVLAADSDEL